MKLGQVELQKAPIRAVKYHNDKLLYGQGDRLNFMGSDIIIPGSEKIISLISGSKNNLFIITEFKLFKFCFLNISLMQIHLPAKDRILTVLDEDIRLWVVQARGTVHLFDYLIEYTLIKSYSLQESSSIFYSASIIRKCNDDLIEIAFGTIFSGILMTKINSSDFQYSSLYYIKGHKGSVFDLKYHPGNQNLLISCSDDRSVRIWTRDENDQFSSAIICTGHDARVWSFDVKHDLIASVSEDNSCIIWEIKTGKLLRKIEYDSNSKSIWSVSINELMNKLVIGSNDGSVIVHEIFSQIKQYHNEIIIPGIYNFVVNSEGDLFYTTANDIDGFYCLTKMNSLSSKFIIFGLGQSPPMAVDNESLYIADNFGNLFIKNFSDSGIHKLNFKLSCKITKIFVKDDFILLETLNNEVCLYDTKSEIINSFHLDKKLKMTSYNYFKSVIRIHLIGTRQGFLILFNENFEFLKEIEISKNEALKSIKFKNSYLQILDRSGMEHFMDLETFTISRRISSRGIIESYLDEDNNHKIGGEDNITVQIDSRDLISAFYQQNFIISDPEFGILEKIFCGGGHRLLSFQSKKDEISFAYSYNGKINLYQGSINRPEIVSKKSHGKEIRCAHSFNDFVVSGSEDGLIILYKELVQISEVRLFNTSIKCITSINNLFFFGGSNETIEIYELDSNSRFIQCTTCPKQILDIETRVLCMDVAFEKETGMIILFVGYSNASIRIFEYNQNKKSISLLSCITQNVHNHRCVQQIKQLGNNKFITAGTDGFISLWNHIGRKDILKIWEVPIHQSGINGFDIKIFEDKLIKIISGGEDGNVVLTEILNEKVIKIICKSSHHSTVTGVKFLNNLILSTSIDRNILISDSLNEKEIQIKRTVISDISAISLTSKYFTVYGSGMETFSLLETK